VNNAMDTTRIQTPKPVPAAATRFGESREWQRGTLTLTQESLLVWTERMLAALERGNDKRKWGRGRDHNRYPNAWFAERGLISLITITHGAAASPAK
jgi:hypothetical protein